MGGSQITDEPYIEIQKYCCYKKEIKTTVIIFLDFCFVRYGTNNHYWNDLLPGDAHCYPILNVCICK